ncbi:hypothetical protein P4S73_13745 [Paraglaciecola sp. Hal342]
MYIADEYFDSQLPDTKLQLTETELRILIDDFDRKSTSSTDSGESKTVPNFKQYDDVTEKEGVFCLFTPRDTPSKQDYIDKAQGDNEHRPAA